MLYESKLYPNPQNSESATGMDSSLMSVWLERKDSRYPIEQGHQTLRGLGPAPDHLILVE